MTELTLVPFKGKGIGFVIGIVFSTFRLYQLILLKKQSTKLVLEDLFVILMMTIWSYNILHIILYRIIPLTKMIIMYD